MSRKIHTFVMELPCRWRSIGSMEILGSLQRFEARLFERLFRQTERRMVIPLARAISRSGDGYVHVLVPLLVLSLDPESVPDLIALLALSLAVERSLYWLVKNSLRRPRPQESVPGFRSLITASDQFSFPSGHSSGAFLLAAVLLLIYGGAAAPMFLWAGAVALSRILLGVHFPGDTLAGALMGSGIALITAAQLGLY
ncbi:phosphatase PAP2 family protein [Haliea sp. E17]|uniref:phosphatase PAP2 family protein n=1 Tax=Haliea sp. E17 TaxID=3401576 RepID=UPI003AAE69E9